MKTILVTAAEALSEARGAGARQLASLTFDNLEHGRERAVKWEPLDGCDPK
jgi:hypothetical protein